MAAIKRFIGEKTLLHQIVSRQQGVDEPFIVVSDCALLTILEEVVGLFCEDVCGDPSSWA